MVTKDWKKNIGKNSWTTREGMYLVLESYTKKKGFKFRVLYNNEGHTDFVRYFRTKPSAMKFIKSRIKRKIRKTDSDFY